MKKKKGTRGRREKTAGLAPYAERRVLEQERWDETPREAG